MPIIKEGISRLTNAQMTQIRELEPYAYRVIEEGKDETEGKRKMLAVRTPAEPNPVKDLERTAELIPVGIVGDLAAVVLIGDQTAMEMDAIALANMVVRRERMEFKLVSHLRSVLQRDWGYSIFRLGGRPYLRIGLRVPQKKAEIQRKDLRSIKRIPRIREATIIYLIADDEYVRTRAEELPLPRVSKRGGGIQRVEERLVKEGYKVLRDVEGPVDIVAAKDTRIIIATHRHLCTTEDVEEIYQLMGEFEAYKGLILFDDVSPGARLMANDRVCLVASEAAK